MLGDETDVVHCIWSEASSGVEGREDLNVSSRKQETVPRSSPRGKGEIRIQTMRSGFYITTGRAVFKGGLMLLTVGTGCSSIRAELGL